MRYLPNLLLRLLTAFLLVFFGSEIFYFILFYPTFYLSYLSLLSYNPVLINNSLIINNINLVFIPACLAASAYTLLSLLILLTKDINLKKGIKIFLTGFFTLFFVNLIRIFLLAVLLIESGIKLFNTFHLFFWQVFSTIFVLLLWIFLTKYFKVKTIPVYSDYKELLNKIK
ncbi:pacearchaeosortase [Candidatus Woesearchaeota archaeon]|nr:pacearchaeosortase [Candidatus Woesearchaeota archaeon]